MPPKRPPADADEAGSSGRGGAKKLVLKLSKPPLAVKKQEDEGVVDLTADGGSSPDAGAGPTPSTSGGSPASSDRPARGRRAAAKGKGKGKRPARQWGEEDADSEEEDMVQECNVRLVGEDPTDLRDFSNLELKPDHATRPLYVCPDGRIFLETFSPIYKTAYDFLIAVAEPVCRPECVHEYALTPHSLYAAVSVGLETNVILSVLGRLSKTRIPPEIDEFVRASTQNYGKVKLVLQRNKFFVESRYPEVLRSLLQDEVIAAARLDAPALSPDAPAGAAAGPSGSAAGGAAAGPAGRTADGFTLSTAPSEAAAAALVARVGAADEAEGSDEAAESAAAAAATAAAAAAAAAAEHNLHSFEIDPAMVEHVKQRCLPEALNYPMLEEYDFRNDAVNPDLPMELKPIAHLRPYQEKSLSKMFGNGRARSGIIVLPCGAGKSLTGVAAAARVRKSCLVLCTSAVSVDQWKQQFLLWSTVPDASVSRFTSSEREMFASPSGVFVTTYSMIAFKGRRAQAAQQIIAAITAREWGLMLLDEVHVVPAEMFRKVLSITKSHCKLGLTATLVREDELISDLNFLIGPKLYEANWLDLQREGYIANVQFAEVWCPMTKEFYREYLRDENAPRQQALYVMNPYKFMATQFLINYHETQRGDKILVFSDNIFALKEYATKLRRPMIYGGTSHNERTQVLHQFKHNPKVNTIFISKVGDNSINIPEANVIIQISSHAGSRRQEAQRLGRILRPKARKGGASTDEFNAFFYSLVSRDTVEMFYSAKRQQFLIDQGYAFKVVTNLLEAVPSGELHYSTQREQLDLLAKVLTSSEAEAGVEAVEGDAAADLTVTGGAGGARRAPGNVPALTGAEGLRYMELDSVPGVARSVAAELAAISAAKAAAMPRAGRASLWQKVKKY